MCRPTGSRARDCSFTVCSTGCTANVSGLIIFAGTAFVQVPLSADYQILNEFLPDLKPDYMPQGGTDYAGMLAAAAGAFSDSANADRYLIVLSDGEAQDDSWKNRLPELEKRGVRVIALGVGTAEGGFIPDGKSGFVKDERGAVVLSRLENGTLRSLAQSTDGAYRDAGTWVDLPALLQETVERGRRGAFTEEQSVEHIERFQWFLAPALFFAALGLWREIAVRPRARDVARRNKKNPTKANFPDSSARTSTRVAVRSLVACLAFASCFSGGKALSAAESDADADRMPKDFAAPIRETVTRIATAPEVGANDWQELAKRTVAYGQSARQSGAPVEKGAINDALVAVELGQRQNPKLADWDSLRGQLEKLLEDPPKQKNQKQDQNQQKDQDKNKEKDGPPKSGKGAQDQKQDQKNKDGQQSDQKQDQGQQNQDSKDQPSGGDNSDKDEKDQQNPQNSDSNSDEQKPSDSQKPQAPQQPAPEAGKLGNLDEKKDAEKEKAEKQSESDSEDKKQPQQPPQMRKIGGRPADDRGTAPTDPELAAALQRMRQATEVDSPARLFELLEGEHSDKPKTGKDW